ncbi:MAG: hypothetical protein AABZ62_00755 [Planctomycetota bacterium]
MTRVVTGMVVFLLSAVVLLSQDLLAQEDLAAKVDTLEKELQVLKQQLQKQGEDAAQREKVVAELAGKTEAHDKDIKSITDRGEFTYSDLWVPEQSDKFAKEKLSGQFGGIYTKPFLRRMGRNTYLGGYMDASYRKQERQQPFFEVLRFVPFIYADVSDRVKVAAEIEFEHGGANRRTGVIGDSGSTGLSNQLNGEVKLEFATVDFLIKDWINYRAGIILVPLGKYNLVHDAPLQDLVDRPLVDTRIIPTTLSQAGMGFYGSFYPTEMSKLDYEIYATNGFGNNISSINGIRDARLFRYDRDNNSSPGIVGRVAFSPFLGLEFGGSFYLNKYDKNNWFNIGALDFAFQKGPFELVGEGAYIDIERDKRIKTTQTTVPPNMFGYYIEPRFHFMPEFVRNLAPNFFKEDSTFTLAGRWDQVDTGFDRRDSRGTIGFNFRYTEDTVFKIDYEWDHENRRSTEADNTFVFGVASYF